MSFSPTKGNKTNFLASLRRTMQYGWFGAIDEATQFGQPPTLLNGEFVTAINPTNTGVVNIIGADASGQITTPMQVAISLTAAQIITLHSVPVALIPAPGAGFALLVEKLVIELTLTSTAFTGGGAVAPVYHGATAALTANTLPATVVQGGAGQVVTALSLGAPTNGLTLTANAGIDLYAASADFAAGTGTAEVFVAYSIVTL